MGHQISPNRPRAPHLNGKVERTRRADLEEFRATVDPRAPDIQQRLDEWQHFWNWQRPHSALGSITPMDRICEPYPKTPLREEAETAYDPAKERIRTANYALDATLALLK